MMMVSQLCPSQRNNNSSGLSRLQLSTRHHWVLYLRVMPFRSSTLSFFCGQKLLIQGQFLIAWRLRALDVRKSRCKVCRNSRQGQQVSYRISLCFGGIYIIL
ncbi:hypothetical protein FGO68_gene6024 [Halteria grandinella]|uniref:Uncharacterized protein n=1 Tax=Halteria grandinella TaxID=5974 RepID=A0A8J8P5J7_HALGN|nr:hypothetical protein FGO68_gene6024 [Halteria grandinella]